MTSICFRFARLWLAVLLLPSFAFGQGKLWTVGPTSCPNADFHTIQEAVDAALDGDVIVVRASTGFNPFVSTSVHYPSFTIDGKSLAVVADGEAGFQVGKYEWVDLFGGGWWVQHFKPYPVKVRNLAPGQQVLLRGCNAGSLLVTDCAGSVWVEDSKSFGASLIQKCASVALVRCQLVGTSGTTTLSTWPGLQVQDSAVHFFDNSCKGGNGAGAVSLGFMGSYPAGSGADGIQALGVSSLFLIGSKAQGGQGGPSAWAGMDCASAGDGGDGLFLSAASKAAAIDSTFLGGAEGGGACGTGQPGAPISGAGAFVAFAGTARKYKAAPIVVAEGASASLEFVGQPAEALLAAVGLVQKHEFLPEFQGSGLVKQRRFFCPFLISLLPEPPSFRGRSRRPREFREGAGVLLAGGLPQLRRRARLAFCARRRRRKLRTFLPLRRRIRVLDFRRKDPT